ncbi:MAG: hypothetical protein KA419_00915 [Acidobacteria bacterium]|nr:hypothetical protein [Acidobacteriota bacterium]
MHAPFLAKPRLCVFAFVLPVLLSSAPAAGAGPAKGTGPGLFPQVAGWKMVEGPTAYTRETLFEYIDGAADLFLQYDFRELAAARYENGGKAALTVDVYRMGGPLHAFGVYSRERPAKGSFLPLGAEGYAGDGSVYFLAGDCYVKVSLEGASPEAADAPGTFARELAGRIGGPFRFPPELECFPSAGQVERSEMFTSKDYLGLAFLENVFSAEYTADGKRFTLFFTRSASPDAARALLGRWKASAGSGPDLSGPSGGGTIDDPQAGRVEIAFRDAWIWGMTGEGKSETLAELGRKLKGPAAAPAVPGTAR